MHKNREDAAKEERSIKIEKLLPHEIYTLFSNSTISRKIEIVEFICDKNPRGIEWRSLYRRFLCDDCYLIRLAFAKNTKQIGWAEKLTLDTDSEVRAAAEKNLAKLKKEDECGN